MGNSRVFRAHRCKASALLLLLCCLALRPRAAAQGGTTPSTTSVRIVHGLVVNSATDVPIPRALVTSGDGRMAQLTDSEGRFTFEVRVPASGSGPQGGVMIGGGSLMRSGGPILYLTARKPGYRGMQGFTPFAAADPKSFEGDLRLMLAPESIVAGRVTTVRSEAPAGVTVQLFHKRIEEGYGIWRVLQSQQTDAHGDFRFPDLDAGTYKIMTREWAERGVPPPPPGTPITQYPPVAYPNGSTLATAAPIPVSPGETVQTELHLRLAPYFPIQLPVANYVPGTPASVSVEDGGGSSGFSLGFNQQTQQVEGALPRGLYHVRVMTYGEPPMTGLVELTVAGPVRDLPLSLSQQGTIPVVVHEAYTAEDPTANASNAPPSSSGPRRRGAGRSLGSSSGGRERSVDVYLQSLSADGNGGASLRSPPTGQADANEGLVVEHVQPGSYRVRVMPHRGYAAAVTSNGINLLRQPLVIAPGAGTPPIEITLRDDLGTLSGTVTGTSSRRNGPMGNGPALWCYPVGEDGAADPVPGFVPPDGSFTLSLPPGRYAVVASQSPIQNIEYRDEDTLKRLMGKGTMVTVAAGTPTTNITVPFVSLETK